MEETEPLSARGEAEGAQSPDDPPTLLAKPLPKEDGVGTAKLFSEKDDSESSGGLWDEEDKEDKESGREQSEEGRAKELAPADKEDLAMGHDPLAEAAMNILRTRKQQEELDEEDDSDDIFLEHGDSDPSSLNSGKQGEETDCAEPKSSELIASTERAERIAKKLNDLRIDIPDPTVRLKRRSSSIAELSDAEATGSMERFSPREDPVGSAGGSLPLHGTLTREGEMVSYVADDLTEKIRQSVGSSQSTSGATTPAYPSTSQLMPWATTPTSMTSSSSSTTELGSVASSSLIPPIDPEAIQDLERQCHRVADNLNLMLGHLSNSLHNMSAITVGHIQTYRDAVEKAGITVDKSVKEMYALMAKVEELSFAMPVVYDLAKQIKSINSKLDELESLCK